MTDDGKPKTTYALLGQGVWWRNREGGWVPVAEMSAEYRFSCARMLMMRAKRYAFIVELEELRSLSMFGGPDDGDIEPWTVAHPEPWMRSRPLYEALTGGLPTTGRAARKLAERASHWSTCPMRLRKKLRPADAVCSCKTDEKRR